MTVPIDPKFIPTNEYASRPEMNASESAVYDIIHFEEHWDGNELDVGLAVRAIVGSDWFAAALADAKREERALIVREVRNHCTPSSVAYAAGGDSLIYAVADWIENPPEWVTELRKGGE